MLTVADLAEVFERLLQPQQRVQLCREPFGVGASMNLLAQHVGNPAGTIGPGPVNRYGLRHAVTLTQLKGTFRAAKDSPQPHGGYCAGPVGWRPANICAGSGYYATSWDTPRLRSR